MSRGHRRALIVAAALSMAVSGSEGAQKVSHGNRVMIAAHPLAAQAGLEMYRRGGNVVDAAVAAAWVLGVVEPHGSGIGGEGMMLIHDAATEGSVVVDFKAVAPAGASYTGLDFARVGSWNRSARAASVPGMVAGLELARAKYGRLDRVTVLGPAITFAEEGFEADSSLVSNLKMYRELLWNDAYARAIYFPGDSLPRPGAVLRNPDYAWTLRQVRDGGQESFYQGEVATRIVRHSEKHDAWIRSDDLEAYHPVLRKPLAGEYRGYVVLTTPPPCGGMFLLEALGMLRTFDLATCRARRWYHLHIMAEVFKRMFRDEASVNGDPERTIIPAARVASDDYAFERMRGIELGRAEHPAQVGPGKIDDGCTTQISVMDSAGNAVSLTITLSSLFGTANTVEGAGFMLNNEIQNYNADSSHPNALRPHSRVVTSLVPTLLFRNGETFCAVGTPGGDLILSTLVQVIVNLVDFSMEPEDALAAPRIYSSFTQRVLEMEPGYPAEASDMLRSLGHELRQYDTRLPYFGAVQAVVRDPESRRLTGASDPRRSGEPRGE